MRALPASILSSLAVATLLVACSSGSANKLTGSVPGTGVSDDAPAAAKTYGCQNCHGTDMSGVTVPLDQSKYPGTSLYPPNLTPDKDTGIGNWTDGQLELAIRDGVDNNGEVLCPEMKHFKDITEADMTSVKAWLRGLKPVNKTIPGSICPPLKTAPGM